MDEHDKMEIRVADWLAEGWDWDQIGAALNLEPDEAYRRYGSDVMDYDRQEHPEQQPGTGAHAG